MLLSLAFKYPLFTHTIIRKAAPKRVNHFHLFGHLYIQIETGGNMKYLFAIFALAITGKVTIILSLLFLLSLLSFVLPPHNTKSALAKYALIFSRGSCSAQSWLITMLHSLVERRWFRSASIRGALIKS